MKWIRCQTAEMIIKSSVSGLQPPVPDPPAPWHVAAGTLSVMSGIRGRDTAQEETSILYLLIVGNQRTVLTLQTKHTLWDLPEMNTDTCQHQPTHTYVQMQLFCTPSYTLSPYLITDSYGDVTHFCAGGFTDTEATPVEVPDANVHSCMDTKNISA